jgi:hypothetical protein
MKILVNKNSILFAILLILSSAAQAVTWKIHDPCSNKILVEGEMAVGFPFPNLGQFTINRLTENKIAFISNDTGIASIFNTPQGDDSVVVVSNTEMYAYGWCFHHNGVEPAVMPQQILLKNNSDQIDWFFAYSTYKNGNWLNMCAPAYTRPLKPYCH